MGEIIALLAPLGVHIGETLVKEFVTFLLKFMSLREHKEHFVGVLGYVYSAANHQTHSNGNAYTGSEKRQYVIEAMREWGHDVGHDLEDAFIATAIEFWHLETTQTVIQDATHIAGQKIDEAITQAIKE